MQHLRPVSSKRPALAQFEVILQLVGLVQAVLSLPLTLAQQAATTMTQLNQVFGIQIPQKEVLSL